MDVTQTLKELRKEYQDYLRQQHPDWSENTYSTHASDAFYVWNNLIVPSFAKCLVSDESMAETEKAITDYLKNEVLSDRYQERAKAYYADLCSLKEFVDTKYQGIQNRLGYEFDAEKIIYDCAKQVYEEKLEMEKAADIMCQQVPVYGATSHKMVVMQFQAMMEGKKYTRRSNTEFTIYSLARIAEEYGVDILTNALKAVQENVKYYYEQTGNKSNSICRHCRKIAEKYQVNISFDNSIFTGIIPKSMTDTELSDTTSEVRYWIYSAGDRSKNFADDYMDRIMAIGWSDLGDLSLYESKEDMREKMVEVYGKGTSYMNQVLATWQFANEIKVGDIVYVKQGKTKVIGRGVVTGEYEYIEDRGHYANVRKVDWTHKGEWEHPGQAVTKTLTDITPYTDYVKKLEILFGVEEEAIETSVAQFDLYTEKDFLSDVFMDESQYHTLEKLVLTKKNVILQGAPGVGKTYAAKRLAYSIMGVKDTNRVKMIQFHQSYSYEDFIMGFRPNQSGFELKTGVFYDFCKKAETDKEHKYFFIIDEINRGNLSKIFGELFMLIENDKRGISLQLLYNDEQFSIPSNVYIIGMMNTADRSLAMLDYALRRRFAFYEIIPAFKSAGFRANLSKINNKKYSNLINCVEELNEHISKDESLGSGFCIGHSYFCTKAEIDDDWLNSVVQFELIPLLKEYWFDEPSKVKEWSLRLEDAIK